MRKTSGALLAVAASIAVIGGTPRPAEALPMAQPLAAAQTTVTDVACRAHVVPNRHWRHGFGWRGPVIIHRSAGDGC